MNSDFYQTVCWPTSIGPDDVRSAFSVFVFGPGLTIDIDVICRRVWPVNLAKWFLHNLFQRFIREQEQTHPWRWRHGIPVDALAFPLHRRHLCPTHPNNRHPTLRLRVPPPIPLAPALSSSSHAICSLPFRRSIWDTPRPSCPSPAYATLPRSPRHKYGVSRQHRQNHSLPSSLFREILVPLINPHRRMCSQRRRQRPSRRSRIMLPCPRHGRQRRKAEPEHPLLLRPCRRRWTRAAMRQGQVRAQKAAIQALGMAVAQCLAHLEAGL